MMKRRNDIASLVLVDDDVCLSVEPSYVNFWPELASRFRSMSCLLLTGCCSFLALWYLSVGRLVTAFGLGNMSCKGPELSFSAF
jgi:hypothetical protein